MACKKRKVNDENRKFNDNWSFKYFFIEYKGKAVCLVCRDTVAVFKESNIKRHYESKHQQKYGVGCTDDEDARNAVLSSLWKKFESENVGTLFRKQTMEKSELKNFVNNGSL